MTSNLPRLDQAEEKKGARALYDKLPVCQMCGQKALDYVELRSDKGDLVALYCTVHEIKDRELLKVFLGGKGLVVNE